MCSDLQIPIAIGRNTSRLVEFDMKPWIVPLCAPDTIYFQVQRKAMQWVHRAPGTIPLLFLFTEQAGHELRDYGPGTAVLLSARHPRQSRRTTAGLPVQGGPERNTGRNSGHLTLNVKSHQKIFRFGVCRILHAWGVPDSSHLECAGFFSLWSVRDSSHLGCAGFFTLVVCGILHAWGVRDSSYLEWAGFFTLGVCRILSARKRRGNKKSWGEGGKYDLTVIPCDCDGSCCLIIHYFFRRIGCKKTNPFSSPLFVSGNISDVSLDEMNNKIVLFCPFFYYFLHIIKSRTQNVYPFSVHVYVFSLLLLLFEHFSGFLLGAVQKWRQHPTLGAQAPPPPVSHSTKMVPYFRL